MPARGSIGPGQAKAEEETDAFLEIQAILEIILAHQCAEECSLQ